MEKILLLNGGEGMVPGAIGELLHSREEEGVVWVKFGTCRVLPLVEGLGHRYLRFNRSHIQPQADCCYWHLECLLCGHLEQWMGRMERHYSVCHKLNHEFFQTKTYRLPLGHDEFVLIKKHGNRPVFLAQRKTNLCQKQGEKINLILKDMVGACV